MINLLFNKETIQYIKYIYITTAFNTNYVKIVYISIVVNYEIKDKCESRKLGLYVSVFSILYEQRCS